MSNYPMCCLLSRASIQQSTQESPFYLMYGRDPVLPTEVMLRPPPECFNIDVDDYVHEVTQRMSHAWEAAQVNVKKAQKKQKLYHDQKAKEPHILEGDRVFLYDPAAKIGKAYKFARPFKGPYRVKKLLPNEAELLLISEPNAPSIRVALNRVRQCPKEIGDSSRETTSEELLDSDEVLDTSMLQMESQDTDASVLESGHVSGSCNDLRRSSRIASQGCDE
ncbi:uncharacterized protein [Dysidea avara]|uniref:uncharacterized protein n=1 Tax=Dysidea avara TaxID=196820 RepID=UPI00332C5219